MNDELPIKIRLDRTHLAADRNAARQEMARLHENFKEDAGKAAREEAQEFKRLRDSKGRFIKEGTQEWVDAYQKLGESGKLSLGQLTAGAAAAVLVLRQITQEVAAIRAEFDKVGAKSREMTEQFGDRRDKLRMIAQQENTDVTNDFTLSVFREAKEQRMSQDEAITYRQSFNDAAQEYSERLGSKKEFSDYRKMTGAYATAKNLDPSIAGEMAGGMLGMRDYGLLAKQGKIAQGQEAETALGDMNTAITILQRGQGDTSVLARQFRMASSAMMNEEEMKGTFQSGADLATVISTAAENNPKEAFEQIRAANRGLRGFDSKKAGPLLKQAGVDASTPFMDAIKKIEPIISAEAKRDNVKTEDVLGRYFEDQLTRTAIAVQLNRGLGPDGVYADRAQVAKETAGVKPAQDVIDRFGKTEVGQRREARADVELAKAERGAENSEVEIVRQQALARLIREKRIDSDSTAVQDYLSGKALFGALGSTEQSRIDEETQRTLDVRAPRTTGEKFQGLGNMTALSREKELRDRINRAQAKGIDPLKPAEGEEKKLDRTVGVLGLEGQGGGFQQAGSAIETWLKKIAGNTGPQQTPPRPLVEHPPAMTR